MPCRRGDLKAAQGSVPEGTLPGLPQRASRSIGPLGGPMIRGGAAWASAMAGHPIQAVRIEGRPPHQMRRGSRDSGIFFKRATDDMDGPGDHRVLHKGPTDSIAVPCCWVRRLAGQSRSCAEEGGLDRFDVPRTRLGGFWLGSSRLKNQLIRAKRAWTPVLTAK